MTRSHVHRSRRSGQHVHRNAAITVGLLTILVIGWVAFALFRPLPAPRLVLTIPTVSTLSGEPLSLRPPLGAQEAVAIAGIGTVAVAGEQTPAPIASLTKMMSALVVLHDHPLTPGDNGPNITVTGADVATYRLERSEDDSVVKVRTGERLSEFQALEGALIPSGDNIIQLLATWDAGNTSAFVAKMNAVARMLGMRHTHYAGPSGVNPATVSTAADQLRVAEVAMANPVFASIVATPEVALPVAGTQYNVDADLGSDGIDGIKTGWVPQGGGCFVFSATDAFRGTNVSVVGAILGEQGATPIPTALSTAEHLVVATETRLRSYHLPAGATIGTLAAPYASPIRVVSLSPISLIAWSGAQVQVSLRRARAVQGTFATTSNVGSFAVDFDHSKEMSRLRATKQPQYPSLGWRLTHP